MPTINSVYYGGGQQPNPANVIQIPGAPSSKITEDPLGTIAVNNSTNQSYILSSKSGGMNHWKTVGGGGGTGILDITGNSGGAVGADISNNINIIGDNTTGITVAGDSLTNTQTIKASSSTTTVIGTTRYATNTEASAQTVSNAALTPSNVSSLFSSHPLPVSQGGTGEDSFALNGAIISGGTSTAPLMALTLSDGEVIIGRTGSSPLATGLTAGSGIEIFQGPSNITIAATGITDDINAFWVSKAGSNANSGTNIGSPVLTFTYAVSLAIAQSPSSSNKFVINCMDDGVYAEIITLPSYVDLFAPDASFQGGIVVNDNCHVACQSITVGNGQVAFNKSSGTGTAWIKANEVVCNTHGIGFFCTSGIMMCDWKTMTVNQGFGIGDTSSALAHMHLLGGDIYITGAGVAIARGNSGSTLGHVDHILDIGAGAGTAIQITNGTIDLTVNHIANSVAYNVDGATSTLNLFFEEMSGTRTATGLSLVNVWNPKPYGVGGQVMTAGGTGVDANWANVSALIPPQDNIFYVSKAGNNANFGENIDTAVLTFGQAISLAVAATPSPTSRYAIVCLDDGIYNETFSVPAYVDIFAPNAGLLCDTIPVAGNNNITFRNLQCVTGDTAILVQGTNVNVYISNVEIDAGNGFEVSTNAIAHIKWDTAVITDAGAMLAIDDNAYLYFDGGTTELSGGSTFILAESIATPGWIIGRANVVQDTSGHDSTLITILGSYSNFIMDFNQILGLVTGPVSQGGCTTSITVNDLEATILWDTTSFGGDLQLTYNRAVGTPSGEAYLTRPFKWQNVTSSASMVSQNGYKVSGGTTVNLLLPATSNLYDIIEICETSVSATVKVTQGSGQQIKNVGSTTSLGVAGTMTLTPGGSVKLMCMVANTSWIVLSHEGTLTFA